MGIQLDGAPRWLDVVTAEEAPARWAQADAEDLFGGVWPEYNLHGNHTGAYFSTLVVRFAHLQALLVDRRDGRTVARARTIPFRWDGSVEGLPFGIDAVGLAAITSRDAPTTLSALAAEVVPDRQREGLSRLVLLTMAALARAHRLDALVAPVRPSQKDRYPLTPIERYATWRRDDGLPFDAWLRVHARLGGTLVRAEPRSLEITAPVGEWTAWTGLELPEDGRYVFPEGLAPLDVHAGVGTYFEPNVWVLHRPG